MCILVIIFSTYALMHIYDKVIRSNLFDGQEICDLSTHLQRFPPTPTYSEQGQLKIYHFYLRIALISYIRKTLTAMIIRVEILHERQNDSSVSIKSWALLQVIIS